MRKSPSKYLLGFVCLIASCSSLSRLNFDINTTSPHKTFRVKLEGREQSITSAVQQVKLIVVKGTETILVDNKFYREEADHPFSQEFPVHEWMSDSVLRFSKETTARTSGDKIVVVNNGKARVDVLKVEYASHCEKFLIFDLEPAAKLELPVLPYSTNGEYPNPNVSYTVYENGQSSQNMASGWRKTGGASEILIEIGPAEIDLTTIGALAPKGRVQDSEYNQLPAVEQLIAHGRESIAYLISKLDDETKIEGHVVDYWQEVRVGDVALIILIDFFTDHTWENTTIPGVSWDEFLERGANSERTAEQVLRNYISKHGRSEIKERWQKIWEEYRDKIEWDEKERCFRL